MKLLVVLLAVLAGVWLWRRGRRLAKRAPTAQALPPAQPMVPCRHCSTHVPADEAVAGQAGSYCSAAHRRAAEGA